MRGSHVLGHWSRTQATVALSSGEAELNSALKGGCELLGLRELLAEWGKGVQLELQGDSTACRGMLNREGVGRQKHLQVRQLWLQGHVKNGDIKFIKIARDVNAADTQTKHWSTDARSHFARASFYLLAQ